MSARAAEPLRGAARNVFGIVMTVLGTAVVSSLDILLGATISAAL